MREYSKALVALAYIAETLNSFGKEYGIKVYGPELESVCETFDNLYDALKNNKKDYRYTGKVTVEVLSSDLCEANPQLFEQELNKVLGSP